MDTAKTLEQAASPDRRCRLTVHVAGTPLAGPGRSTVQVCVSPGTPLVWVLGMLAADRRGYDRFTALVDRGMLSLRLNGRNVSWWQEVETDGVLLLLHRTEGMEVGREAGGVSRLDPERPLTLEACHQAFAAE